MIDTFSMPACAEYLPAVLREAIADGPTHPVRAFLDAFEHEIGGVERLLRHTPLLIDPKAGPALLGAIETDRTRSAVPESTTPSRLPERQQALLRWLSSCVLIEDWVAPSTDGPRLAHGPGQRTPLNRGSARPEDLVSSAAWLYRLRGTQTGMVATVQAVAGLDVEVHENTAPPGFRLGVTSSIGTNSWLQEDSCPQRQFIVNVRVTPNNTSALDRTLLSISASASTGPKHILRLASRHGREAWIWGPWNHSNPRSTGNAGDVGPESQTRALVARLRAGIDRECPAGTSYYLALEAPPPNPIAEGEPWLRLGLAVAPTPGPFQASDLRDADELHRRLVLHADPVTALLWASLNQSEQLTLGRRDVRPESQVPLVIEALNRVARGPSIHHAGNFPEPLSRETAATAATNPPEGDERTHLNRLLLEQTFKEELTMRATPPNSVLGRFCLK